MPRSGAGVYTLPVGLPSNGDTSNADEDLRAPLEDVATDLNTPRPIVAGGTGADNAIFARKNLGLNSFKDVATLLANTSLSYSGANAVSSGDIITTQLEGAVYQVASSTATDHAVTTAGAVKLYERVARDGYESRADFVSANSANPGLGLADGQVVTAGGLEYRRLSASTAIADLAGWVPSGETTPQHFGATTAAASSAAAIDAAAAYADKVFVPEPLNYPSAVTVPSGAYEGPASLIVNGNKAARYRSTVKTEPARSTNHGFIGASFDGDYSKVPFPVEHYIVGAATLGQPATGYLYTPEATPHYTNMFVSAGHNQETTGNGGRTGATAYRTIISHVGDGDAVAYNASVFVAGAKAGATGQTGFLANPAGVLLNGEVIAGNNGVYLNNLEINLKGGVYDVAGVGCVFNFYRDDATGNLGAGWDGIRFQSLGAQPVNAGLRFVGAGGFGVGVNFVEMVSANGAAIAMKAGQRIYFDAEDPSGNLFDINLNDTYLSVLSSGGGPVFVVNNNPVLQIAASAAGRTQHLASMDVRPGTDGGQAFGIYGTSATAFLALGQAGTTSFVQAFSSGSDNTSLAFRTASAGVEADGLVLGSTGVVNIAQASGRLQINGTQVLNTRRTGWTAPTGTATRTSFDTATVTTAQLAERVKGLIDDLITHGLIGA